MAVVFVVGPNRDRACVALSSFSEECCGNAQTMQTDLIRRWHLPSDINVTLNHAMCIDLRVLGCNHDAQY